MAALSLGLDHDESGICIWNFVGLRLLLKARKSGVVSLPHVTWTGDSKGAHPGPQARPPGGTKSVPGVKGRSSQYPRANSVHAAGPRPVVVMAALVAWFCQPAVGSVLQGVRGLCILSTNVGKYKHKGPSARADGRCSEFRIAL